MAIPVQSLTIAQIESLLDSGQVSSRELTRAYLDRIEAVDKKTRAFLRTMPDEALAQADAADAARKQGRRGPLLGVPIGLKDILCTRGTPTTCASKILENFIPPYDATVIARLREAGAVFLGKLNMDEFAMGSSCENSGFHPTHNPWDLTRIPGGSSGGSAAAIAAGLCPAALGTDTGGSIRQPASLCGIVGLKPTYGRVSRYGLIAFASSLDQVGPMTRTVEDSAILLGAIAGHDPLDSTSADLAVPDYRAAIGRGLAGLRVGMPREYFVDGMDPEVDAAVTRAIDKLNELGAEIVEISLPHTEYAVATYYIVATAEASSNLARYDGAHYGWRLGGTDNIIDMYSRTRSQGFGQEVQRRIMLGTYVLSAGFYDAYYLKALKVRTLFTRDFEEAFKKVDLIATPTAPTAAFKIGEKVDDPLMMYLNDIFTISVNLAGLPGISLPCGFTSGNLPIGLQLIAPTFKEEPLLAAAHAYEQSQPWWQKQPEL
ncbi:MAG: Asp-tRNA(Asn)/Glu-tRNA(Gln) amidotransferase subunit GatA [Candidatus Sumerlaeia bacterium]